MWFTDMFSHIIGTVAVPTFWLIADSEHLNTEAIHHILPGGLSQFESIIVIQY